MGQWRFASLCQHIPSRLDQVSMHVAAQSSECKWQILDGIARSGSSTCSHMHRLTQSHRVSYSTNARVCFRCRRICIAATPSLPIAHRPSARPAVPPPSARSLNSLPALIHRRQSARTLLATADSLLVSRCPLHSTAAADNSTSVSPYSLPALPDPAICRLSPGCFLSQLRLGP